MSNYRIAVLGDKDSVLGFKALGLDVYPAENVEEILQKEVGLEFARGLEHAGVFKTDEKGRAAFRRFVEGL